LIKIQLTKSNPKKDKGIKMPSLIPIRVKRFFKMTVSILEASNYKELHREALFR
jgi:hypothetical protein